MIGGWLVGNREMIRGWLARNREVAGGWLAVAAVWTRGRDYGAKDGDRTLRYLDGPRGTMDRGVWA